MAVGEIRRLTLYSKQEPQIAVNVLHYRITAETGGGTSLGDQAKAFGNAFGLKMRDVMCANAQFSGVGISHIHPGDPSEPAYDTSNAGNGAVAGEPLPYQNTGIITKKTGHGGRAFRGRFYTPFPGEASNTTDGTPTVAFLTALDVLAAQITATVIATSLSGGSTTLQPILKNKEFPATIRPLTGYVVRDKWAVQRRRGSYGQPNLLPF